MIEPVQDVWIIGRNALAGDSTNTAFRGWWGSFHAEAAAGRFELHGLDPDVEIPVHFLEPRRRLGAVVRLSGKSASGGPLTVRLEPCGTAKARLVDAEGRPLRYGNYLVTIRLVITPGPDYPSRDPEDKKRLSGESDSLNAVDPINYFKPPVADAEGRVAFPALIPGATYRIRDHFAANERKRGHPRPQGIHGEARRNARSWRHPDRKAGVGKLTHGSARRNPIFQASVRDFPHKLGYDRHLRGSTWRDNWNSCTTQGARDDG